MIVEREEQEGVGKSTSRQSAVLCLDGMAACAPFTLRSIGKASTQLQYPTRPEPAIPPWMHNQAFTGQKMSPIIMS